MSNVPVIWALDMATKMGVAEGRLGELPKVYTVDLGGKGQDFEITFSKFTAWLIDRLSVDRPTHVVIEAPLPAGALMNRAQRGFRSNSNTFRILYGLPAIAHGVFRKADVFRVQEKKIGTVRSFFIGHGNLGGELSKHLVMQRCIDLGLEPEDDNASDAAALFFHKANELDADTADLVCKRQPKGRVYEPITNPDSDK